MVETVRKLKKVHFEFDTAHLAYTDESQGGAASGINAPYLLKSADEDIDKALTKNQKALLEKMSIEVSGDIDKSVSSEKDSGLSSPSGDSTGEQPENKTNEGNKMSVDKNAEDRILALEKALAQSEAKVLVMPYKLEAEVSKGLVDALASLSSEDQLKVTKALDVLVAQTQEAVNKALEVEKAAKTEEKKEENPVLKALSEEQGHSEKAPATGVEKSMLEKIKEETDKLVNKGNK